MAGLIARNWDKFAEQSLAPGSQGEQSQRAKALKERAKSATGLFGNPIALGLGSVAGGLLLGRRLQSQQGQHAGATRPRDGEPLGALSKQELQARASEAGIGVRRSMTKADLIEALERSGERGRAGSRQKANPIEIQKFLEGLEYPATRDTLLKEANRQGADERVLGSLERLPRKRFEDPTDVSEALGASA